MIMLWSFVLRFHVSRFRFSSFGSWVGVLRFDAWFETGWEGD